MRAFFDDYEPIYTYIVHGPVTGTKTYHGMDQDELQQRAPAGIVELMQYDEIEHCKVTFTSGRTLELILEEQ
jgi:hypothetical protein